MRPLYQRPRALFLANAPHASRHRLGLRAARALPCVSERCGSDADTLPAAALAAGEPNAARDRHAVSGDEPSDVAFGEPVGEPVAQCISKSLRVPGRLRLARLFARRRERFAFAVPDAVGVADPRSDAVTRGARGRAGA